MSNNLKAGWDGCLFVVIFCVLSFCIPPVGWILGGLNLSREHNSDARRQQAIALIIIASIGAFISFPILMNPNFDPVKFIEIAKEEEAARKRENEEAARKREREEITGKDNDGNTPLHLAALNCNLDRVKSLLNKGAEVRAKNLVGQTPLHHATHGGNLEIVQLLVFQGADVNAKDAHGDTPLIVAAWKDLSEIADFLISKGANINAKSDNGSTPLGFNNDTSRNLAEKYKK